MAQTKGYYTRMKITDYGPYITKIILPFEREIAQEDNDYREKFCVYVERLDEKGEILELPKSWLALDDREPSKGYIPVTDAYPSDKNGEKCERGEFLTLEMAYGPLYPLSAAISAPNGYNVYVNSVYRITQIADIASEDGKINGLVYDYSLGNQMPDAAGFFNAVSSYKEPLNYGYFVPQAKGKRPLIIWLHGAGEGGVDATIAYTANKVVRLASPEVQALFGGAYILAPQTKTYWMDDGAGTISESGKTIYAEALKACIDEFVENHEGIDTSRIYIGGDSNGGFMTMKMIIAYPDFFAAAFPICEALRDDMITDEDINSIKDIPIWFTHAKNDPLVIPDKFVVPTYERLIKAGASDVHFTFWDKICDIHEGFVDEQGNPYEYIGHFAWIPMLNDDCRLDYDGTPVVYEGREVTLLQWLALHSRALHSR